jgi:hypothetical protein
VAGRGMRPKAARHYDEKALSALVMSIGLITLQTREAAVRPCRF